MEELFTITYLPNNILHGDIRCDICFAEEAIPMDSYYLSNEKGGTGTILNSIQNILFKWRKAVLEVSFGVPIYLMLDFSDQYYGGFCLELDKSSRVKLSYGIIREAFDLNMEPVIYSLGDYEFVKTHECETTLVDLLSSIEVNISNLRETSQDS